MNKRILNSLVAATMLVGVAGFAAPANALSSDDGTLEPPGLDGRETHLTVLTTRESNCTELAINRAVTVDGARALVPERYNPTVVAGGGLVSGRFTMWDYVCDGFRVDGQMHPSRTQISLGAIAVSTRDGVPVGSSYYLVSLATDNPVLAARYQQVGLPATFARDLHASVSDPSSSPFRVSFTVPTTSHQVSAVGEAAPVPVPTAGGPALFHEGGSGEVMLRYTNTMGGTAPTQVTADYRQHELLAPIVSLPRLVQISGAPGFVVIRGDWDATVTRLP